MLGTLYSLRLLEYITKVEAEETMDVTFSKAYDDPSPDSNEYEKHRSSSEIAKHWELPGKELGTGTRRKYHNNYKSKNSFYI